MTITKDTFFDSMKLIYDKLFDDNVIKITFVDENFDEEDLIDDSLSHAMQNIQKTGMLTKTSDLFDQYKKEGLL